MKPLVIDLFCGLGGWTEGFLAEGYECIGFDIERHDYGTGGYPGQLVIQDVLTLHGSQFKEATVIVASPPCQAYSYRAMPWSKARALPPPDNTLFEAPFRIAGEAGRPVIVENVRGAERWVGPAQWKYGSFYLWGDVPCLMPLRYAGIKLPGNNEPRRWEDREIKRLCDAGIKNKDSDGYARSHPNAFGWKSPRTSSKAVNARKFAAAQIAKIPFPLSSYIARHFKEANYEPVLALQKEGQQG